MKKIFILLMAIPFALEAQVPKKVVIEHFTNTYCSICASRNPDLFTNLANFPNVLHIAYHPSSPYPACPLNQHNTTENNARTNFYGVFGGTPRIVVQGKVIPATTSFADATLFNTQTGQTSAFEVRASIHALQGNMMMIKSVVKKVSASSLTSLKLYGAVVEDTLMFNAQNGETVHHDVFRKAVWNQDPISISTPVNIGDSTESMQTISVDNTWNIQTLYAVLILQDDNNEVVQAERSNYLSSTVSTINIANENQPSIYPNPAGEMLYINGITNNEYRAVITNISGVTLKDETQNVQSINISNLAPGLYFINIFQDAQKQTLKFIKQ